MNKKLNYKGIVFDSFGFADDDCNKYVDESNIESLDNFQGGGWGYICPHCIKKYGLYEETDLTEQKVDKILTDDYEDDFICCVDGCNNRNAFDISFNTSDCKLV